MSLASFIRTHTDRRPDALSALSDTDARRMLAAMPTASALSPDDHADALQAAVIVAACRMADGEDIGAATAYGWRACADQLAADILRADRSTVSTDDDDTAAVAASLPRSATPSPEAAYRWSVSDTVTVARALVRADDPSADVLLDILAAVAEEDWHGGLPTRDALVTMADLFRVRVDRRTVRETVRAAVATLATACAVVESHGSHGRRSVWSDTAATLADTLAVAAGQPCARSTTGTGTSGPASDTVTRYRDTLADAWRTVVETVETVDPETGETVTVIDPETGTARPVVETRRTLQAVTDGQAADILATVDRAAYRRTADTLAADAWSDRLNWSPGPVAAPSRKPSRVGSTGPTVPVRLSR